MNKKMHYNSFKHKFHKIPIIKFNSIEKLHKQ